MNRAPSRSFSNGLEVSENEGNTIAALVVIVCCMTRQFSSKAMNRLVANTMMNLVKAENSSSERSKINEDT